MGWGTLPTVLTVRLLYFRPVARGPAPAPSAFAVLNAAGGVDGRPVQLLQRYYAGDPAPAAAAFVGQAGPPPLTTGRCA